MDFETWLKQIDNLAHRDGWADPAQSYVEMTGQECWRSAYDDGLTPDDAWTEELYAAASLL